MNYHAPTGKFVIPQGDFIYISDTILYAIKNVRELAELPLTPHESGGRLTNADHAQIALMDIADKLGIDLGAKRHFKIDVSKI